MTYKEFLANTARQCAVVAHRGLWRAAPENSLLAIEQAIGLGCEVVEIDVRRSSDGEFFLLHDDTLERMAGLTQGVEQLPGHELAKLALRDRDGGPTNMLTEELLPRLEDVFALTRDRIFIHLDIKDRALIGEVIALAEAAGVGGQVDVWADVASEDDVAFVDATIKPRDVAFIARTRLERADAVTQVPLILGLQPDVCEVSFAVLDQVVPVREQCDAAGISLWVNTLDDVASPGFNDSVALQNPQAVWGRLLDAGIRSVQTDEAGALQRFLMATQ